VGSGRRHKRTLLVVMESKKDIKSAFRYPAKEKRARHGNCKKKTKKGSSREKEEEKGRHPLFSEDLRGGRVCETVEKKKAQTSELLHQRPGFRLKTDGKKVGGIACPSREGVKGRISRLRA